MRTPALLRIVIAAACTLAWAAGCSDRNDSPDSARRAEPETSSASSTARPAMESPGGAVPAPLERSLSLWRGGDPAGAIQHFLGIDFQSGTALFGTGSALRLREKDLAALPASARDRLLGEAMLQLRDLKQLAMAVREKGAAAAATDPSLSRSCQAKLEECGAALDQPEALAILRLTAQAIRKSGRPPAAQPRR